MRGRWMLVGLMVAVSGLVGGVVRAGEDDEARAEDVQAIQALNAAFKKAYDEGDAEGVGALFVEQGEVANEAGQSVQGRAAIAEHFERAFEASPGETIELVSDDLSFLAPGLARETGHAVTRSKDGDQTETTYYRAILAKQDGKWLQATVLESGAPALTAHERLEELSWLIGEWVDESEDAVVETRCDWSEDGSYLLRTFSIEVGGERLLSGSQRIGWDERAKQFRSWVFDPDGGHSEGRWSRVGNRAYRIRATGVLADGTEVSATQTISADGEDRLRWWSYDRAIGGEAVPDLPEILLVRKPPAPAVGNR